MKSTTKQPSWLRNSLLTGVMVVVSASALAIVADLTLIESLHLPAGTEHRLDQKLDINAFAGTDKEKFDFVFVEGDEFFEISLNVLDGAGANVGDGTRFTRVPRADLDGPGEWKSHTPPRSTGPNGQGCVECHNVPFGTFAGTSALVAHRDPKQLGELDKMIRRDTPHLAGSGALQLLAQEMTTELHSQRKSAGKKACRTGKRVERRLKSKGVKFGKIVAYPVGHGHHCEPEFHNHKVEGIDHDLVVKPYQWKGSDPSLRVFNRGALHNELGIQTTSLVGYGVDGDGDKVKNEAGPGNVSGLVTYIAGQPRPTTGSELGKIAADPATYADSGIDPELYPELSADEEKTIRLGKKMFNKIGCASCHVPAMKLNNAEFTVPSQHILYREEILPSGDSALDEGLDPKNPVRFNLTTDLPDNHTSTPLGSKTLGNFETDSKGSAIVRLYGDLKRHDMGHGLAESVDEVDTGKATFLTKELWGVGDTAPYLHDGRASTLTEAITEHGGEAKSSRDKFVEDLSPKRQAALIAFLNNLKLFKGAKE